MFAILCTDGELDYKAVIKECRPEKWIPLFAYYEAKSPNKPIIPLFHDDNTAKNFAKRNFPKEWLKGAVFVTPENIAWMTERGWEMNPMAFPRKMNGLPGITFGFEVMDFFEEPDIMVRRGNQ